MKYREFKRRDGKKLGIEITKYPSVRESATIRERHRNNFHAIHFLLAGKDIHEVDFEEYTLQANQVLIVPTKAIHSEEQHSSQKGFSIYFTDEFFAPPQKELLNGFLQYAISSRKLLIQVPKGRLQNLIYYFELLWEEQAQEQNQNQIFILQNLMLALLNKLEGLIQFTEEDNSFINQRALFQQFIALVENHFVQQKSTQFYTQQLAVTARHLNDILKSLIGLTAQDFIIERTLLEAKRQLCFSPKSIKEIAYELGYDNPYYFSRIFKKRNQYSPDEFRRQFAE